MFDSVRTRLTLWHVAILALLLIAVSASLYTLLRQNFYRTADGILESVASATVSILGKELSESGLDELAARDAVKTLNFPNYTLAIFDAQGDLLAEKPVGAGDRIALFRETALPDGVVELYTVSLKGGPEELQRVAALRKKLDPVGRTYTVVASRSLTPLLGELNTDRWILSLSVLTGLLLAGLGGWFLSKKSLEPVLEMSQYAHRIGAENLDQRLPIINPRDELGRLAVTFNDLLSRLSSAFALQRQFMAEASHQLRTPLSVIRLTGSVTLEKEERTQEEYRAALMTIDEQSRRLSKIVEDMFLLARSDARHLTIQARPFYLDELLVETARAANVLGKSKNVTVDVRHPQECPCVGDEELLRQMILNLLDNAIRHSKNEGHVELKLEHVNGQYTISVTDEGDGIPVGAKSHIFERFFRAEASCGRAGNFGSGTGLGLPIARSIAEAHRGSLSLAHSDSSGTTFVAILPSMSRPDSFSPG
jgi:heavy metal sensor kinase